MIPGINLVLMLTEEHPDGYADADNGLVKPTTASRGGQFFAFKSFAESRLETAYCSAKRLDTR